MGSPNALNSLAQRAVGRSAPMVHFIDALARRYIWIAHALLWAGFLSFGWLALDRDPPFAVISVAPAEARAGEYVTITARVWRDTTRRCSANISRYLYTENGARYDMGSSFATVQFIEDLESRSPGILKVLVLLPTTISPGAAELISAIEYRCNSVHRIWPIEVFTSLPFRVLP